MPVAPAANVSIPVVLWGEGNCVGDGLAYKGFLQQVASFGIMIIANGWVASTKPKNGRDTTKDMRYFTDSITWIQAQAGKGRYATVDATALGAAGHSCGGLQTIEMRNDTRIRMLAPFGYFTRQPEWAAEIRVPVGAFVGSLDTSIAYPQIQKGWPRLPATTPGWWGTFPNLNHGGTFGQPDGGKWAVSFKNWILFTLKGDAAAAEYFRGDGAKADGWQVQKQNLEAIRVAGA